MKRIAVVLDKTLPFGAQANTSVILGGALAVTNKEIYGKIPLIDQTGQRHAEINNSIIVLEASRGQISDMADVSKEIPGLQTVVFTREGQVLNDSYPRYERMISLSRTEDLEIIGIGIYGNYEDVKELTRRLGLLK